MNIPKNLCRRRGVGLGTRTKKRFPVVTVLLDRAYKTPALS
jgi:hypothetical protein